MTRLFLFAALSLSMILPAQAADNTGIGYVDMQKVLEDSKLGKALQDELRKEFEPRAKEFKQEEQEIQKLQQELERDKPLMSKAQVEKKGKDLQTRVEAYQKKVMPIQQELMKTQQEKGRKIIGPARQAVNDIAKKKKLGMVVEHGQAGLLYMDESLDLTAEVIKQLDASTK